MNTEPLEIIAAPFTVWLAPVGSTFPDIDAEPDAPWVKVGTSGDLNYLDDGVKVAHSQSINFFRALGDCGSRKAFRTEEDLKISLVLADLTLEQYKLALNSNTVTDTPASVGVAGIKSIGLSRGFGLATSALLVRGPSAYMEEGQAQYEVPIAVQTGTPEVVFRKDTPAALALEWTALVDPDASAETERFGRLIVQTADAET